MAGDQAAHGDAAQPFEGNAGSHPDEPDWRVASDGSHQRFPRSHSERRKLAAVVSVAQRLKALPIERKVDGSSLTESAIGGHLTTTPFIVPQGLLLLLELNQGNTNIQKIVAFENAFERILGIITEEGCSDGGVIVEDCLRLLLTLLKNNSQNQTLFKEGSFVQHLTPFFELSSDDTDSQRGWSAQKVVNFQLMLQVRRSYRR